MTKIFRENFELIYPGEKAGAFQSFEYDECLVDVRTVFQHIQIFQTKLLGKVLVLDGIVQCTELDEFIYHEMLVHVPMFSHREPKRVLIVGGGDGGSLREVLKHKSVEEVLVCEIDAMVIALAIKHLGADAAFNDPRVQIHDADATEALRDLRKKFDVIIVDTTDPQTSGGEAIYTRHFANTLARVLSKNGTMSMMCGVPMAQGLDHIVTFNKTLSFLGFFPSLYTTAVPTYYGGLTAMCFYGGTGGENNPVFTDGMRLKHYNDKIHHAAFVLPNWLKEMANDT